MGRHGESTNRQKCFYWTVANLPPELRACIDNIQLALLCKSVYVQHFGVYKVLKKFPDDVSVLETSEIFVDSLGAEIRGTASFVAADDLAAHMLFGLAQSFGPAVDRFCRYCLATNSGALQKSLSDAEVFPLRTPVNYQYHLAQVADGVADPSTYGIWSDSVLHNLRHFHATEVFPQICHMTC